MDPEAMDEKITFCKCWDICDIPEKIKDFGKSPVVIFLEKTGDVSVCRKIRESFSGNLTIIAVTPGVVGELERAGIEYTSVNHYSDDASLTRLGRGNFRRVEEICTDIDNSISSITAGEKQIAIKPAYDNYFYLKILYDGLTIRLQIILDIISSVRPGLVIYCSSGNDLVSEYTFHQTPFSQEERIYGSILGLPGLPFRTVRINTPGPCTKKRNKFLNDNILSPLIDKIWMIPFITNGYFILKYRGISALLSFGIKRMTKIFKPRRTLLLVGAGYSWEYAAKELGENSYDIRCIPVTQKNHETKESERLNYSWDRVPEKILFEGIDISPLFYTLVKPLVEKVVDEADLIIREFDRYILQNKPVALIAATHTIFYENLCCRAAAYYGIPVIVWQHGSQGFDSSPLMHYVELMNSDMYLCFGPGVKKNYEDDPANKFECKIIPVGSYDLEKIYKKSRNPTLPAKKILYATNNYSLNDFYVSPTTILHDNELYNSQKKILTALGESGAETVLKLHPGQYWEKQLSGFTSIYSNISVIKNHRSFIDLLNDADIVIIDFPSTVLLEAIAANKIVFVLLRHQRITPEALHLLKKRVYYSDDTEEFVTMITRYLIGGQMEQSPDIQNMEFLRDYGICNYSGSVTARVLKVLDTCAKNQKRH